MVPSQENSSDYSEWQLPRANSFLPVLLLIPAIWIVAAPFNASLGLVFGVLAAVATTIIKITNAKRIAVTKNDIVLGSAKIPRKVLGEVEIIENKDQFANRGPALDSRAFVFIKYGLPGMVKIAVNDKADPTPYLLISTRRPEALAAALKN